MKVKVLQEFRDKFNYNKSYKVGEVVEFEKERAEDIIERGLGEKIVVRKPKAKE